MKAHIRIFGETITQSLMDDTKGLSKEHYATTLINSEAIRFMIQMYMQGFDKKSLASIVDDIVEEREQHLESKGEF